MSDQRQSRGSPPPRPADRDRESPADAKKSARLSGSRSPTSRTPSRSPTSSVRRQKSTSPANASGGDLIPPQTDDASIPRKGRKTKKSSPSPPLTMYEEMIRDQERQHEAEEKQKRLVERVAMMREAYKEAEEKKRRAALQQSNDDVDEEVASAVHSSPLAMAMQTVQATLDRAGSTTPQRTPPPTSLTPALGPPALGPPPHQLSSETHDDGHGAAEVPRPPHIATRQGSPINAGGMDATDDAQQQQQPGQSDSKLPAIRRAKPAADATKRHAPKKPADGASDDATKPPSVVDKLPALPTLLQPVPTKEHEETVTGDEEGVAPNDESDTTTKVAPHDERGGDHERDSRQRRSEKARRALAARLLRYVAFFMERRQHLSGPGRRALQAMLRDVFDIATVSNLVEGNASEAGTGEGATDALDRLAAAPIALPADAADRAIAHRHQLEHDFEQLGHDLRRRLMTGPTGAGAVDHDAFMRSSRAANQEHRVRRRPRPVVAAPAAPAATDLLNIGSGVINCASMTFDVDGDEPGSLDVSQQDPTPVRVPHTARQPDVRSNSGRGAVENRRVRRGRKADAAETSRGQVRGIGLKPLW